MLKYGPTGSEFALVFSSCLFVYVCVCLVHPMQVLSILRKIIDVGVLTLKLVMLINIW